MDHFIEATKDSASPTLDTDADPQTEMFCMELQTCVITAEGREIHLMKINNVVAFSCNCLRCGKDISAKSFLESHLRTHLNTKETVPGTTNRLSAERISDEDNDRHDHSILGKTEVLDDTITAYCSDNIKETDDGQESSASDMSKNQALTDRSKIAEPVSIAQKTLDINTHLLCKALVKRRQIFSKGMEHIISVEKDKDAPTSLTEKHTTDELTAKSRRLSRKKKLAGGELREGDSDQKPYVCTICGNKYNRGCELGAHLKWHERDEPRCQECGKLFARPIQLQRHILVHTGEKKHSCAICGKHFRLESQVKMHMVTHTQEKHFKCTLCGKAFCRNGALKKHYHVHKGGRSFMCSQCGKTFRLLNTLNRHVEEVHEEKHYTCEVCGQVLRSQSIYRVHCMRHNDEKPHLCSECGKCFTRKCDLTSHVRTHTGEKPYSCSVCGKMFNQKCYLEEHVRIHTGEKPLKCTKCGLAFRIRSAYRRHIKKKHQQANQYEEIETSSTALLENTSSSDINLPIINLTDGLTNMR